MARGARSGAAARSTRWLVNNAGVDKLGPLIKRTPEELRDRAAQLRERGDDVRGNRAGPRRGACGRVVNVGSVAGFQPIPHDATYAASKAFVLSFTEALSIELHDSGVTATAVCPGPVNTEIFDKLAPGVPRKRPAGEISAEECARFAIAAAESGQVIAIPGARNRLAALTSKLLPRALVRQLAGRIGLRLEGYDVTVITA